MATHIAEQEALCNAQIERAARFNYARQAIDSAVKAIEIVNDADSKKKGVEVILASFSVMLETLNKGEV